MFVQLIRGQVTGREQVHAALDRWSARLAGGAPGWLGSTAGVTGDGRFVALARFASEEAARRNGARPEQDQWRLQTAKLFTGQVTVRDSSDVTVDVHGDPGGAGFVPVLQGRGSDLDRARELMAQNPDDRAAFRPDVIGSVTAGHQGGACTLALYLTSEQAARDGEGKEPPPQLKAQMQELNRLNVGEPEFLDLRHPGSTHPEQHPGSRVFTYPRAYRAPWPAARSGQAAKAAASARTGCRRRPRQPEHHASRSVAWRMAG